jgi:copper chaperone CopZ
MYVWKIVGCFALVVASLQGLAATSEAADVTQAVITVDGMHCPACAKKIVRKMLAVPGVADASADAEQALVTVTAKADAPRSVSPRALWEAVEKAGYTPTKLVGPWGSFTTKPKS